MKVSTVVPIRDYPAETKKVAGKYYDLAALKSEDVRIFVNELETIVHEKQHPIVKEIIVRNAPLILDLIRMVNKNTKQGFKGYFAEGNQLDINYARAADYGKTSWLASYTSTGGQDWLYSSASPKTMTEEEGLIILGVIDPIEVPKVDCVQLVKNNEVFPQMNLALNVKDAFGTNKVAVAEFKEPWIIPPEEKFYARVNVFATGDDKLEPISFWVKRAVDLKATL